jgi:hypothetical protein
MSFSAKKTHCQRAEFAEKYGLETLEDLMTHLQGNLNSSWMNLTSA